MICCNGIETADKFYDVMYETNELFVFLCELIRQTTCVRQQRVLTSLTSYRNRVGVLLSQDIEMCKYSSSNKRMTLSPFTG